MLWNKIPEDRKNDFFITEDVEQQKLVLLWTYDLKGELAKLENMMEINDEPCTPYQYAFEYAAHDGNKVATEFFLKKLTPEEREECLERIVQEVAYKRTDTYYNITNLPKENFADVVCFLLSQLNEEQQKNVFKENTGEILECFLEWPWQRLFMNASKPLLTLVHEEYNYCLLEAENYYQLFWVIIHQMEDGYKDWNYQKLFGEFWQQSPIYYKWFIVKNRCITGCLIPALLKLGDNENMDLILKYASSYEREWIFDNEWIHLYKSNHEEIYSD